MFFFWPGPNLANIVKFASRTWPKKKAGPQKKHRLPFRPPTLAIQKVSSFLAYTAAIFDIPLDVMLCQETTLPCKDWQIAYDEVKARQDKAIFTNTDPELDCTGGVGVVFKHFGKIIQLEPNTKQFTDMHKTGRVQLIGIRLPGDVVLVIANVYGWMGGHQNKHARMRTDSLISAILHEFDHLPPGPKLIVGDFNCEPPDFPSLETLLRDGSYIDIGAHAHIFGQTPHQPTCYHYNNGKPSRRDFAFASSDLLPLVSGF